MAGCKKCKKDGVDRLLSFKRVAGKEIYEAEQTLFLDEVKWDSLALIDAIMKSKIEGMRGEVTRDYIRDVLLGALWWLETLKSAQMAERVLEKLEEESAGEG